MRPAQGHHLLMCGLGTRPERTAARWRGQTPDLRPVAVIRRTLAQQELATRGDEDSPHEAGADEQQPMAGIITVRWRVIGTRPGSYTWAVARGVACDPSGSINIRLEAGVILARVLARQGNKISTHIP